MTLQANTFSYYVVSDGGRFDTGTNTNSEEAAYFDLRIFYKVIFRNNSGDWSAEAVVNKFNQTWAENDQRRSW